MLFLPQSVYDTRRRLWNDLEAGKIPAEKAFQKMLNLDPDDLIGLLGLGRLRLEAGDFAAAEEYFWRGLQAHPCTPAPYLQLAQLFNQRPESVALANALGDLGISKRALDDETFLEGMDFEEAGLQGEVLDEFKKLPAIAQAHVIITALREGQGDDEPNEVTERVAPFRLLQQMQEEGDLDPETVDAIVGQGESMAPLLVGVMREWAQDLLGEEAGDGWVENALALLGETGTPSEIPHLLEFADLEDEDLSGAADWALGRIIERHTEEAAEFIGSIAPGFGMTERLEMMQQILRHPDLDPTGKLLNRMSENLESLKRADRDAFFPLLLVALATARGREGVKLGRAALLQHSGLLSRDARRECDALLAAVPRDFSPPPIEPSPVTVYDICAGNAVWGEDDDEDEEAEDQEFLPAPEPMRRKATPGRNDPCWCNSGKKYKKCHLESDEREASPARVEEPAGLPGPDQFVGLRRRIGEFLGQILPKRDVQLALHELFGDEEVEDGESANISITDWMLHDRIAPSLGRTVMQEFLVRRGSGLTPPEREMVESWTQSFVGLYEVQELTPGAGLTLKDLIFGGTFFVHDVSMSKRLARWDGLLARVVPGERGTELAGIGLTVPRHSLDRLHLWMEEDRVEAGLEWREYLKGNWPRIRRQSFDLAENWVESLQLSNTEGEEIMFSKAVYKVIDEAAVIKALHQCPELQSESSEPAPPHFVWLNQQKTVLGNIHIERGELVLESNSRERMERGKLLLSSVAGASLRHLRDEFTTQKELKSRAAAAPRSQRRREDEIPKEERDDAIAHFLEEHYRAWPDMKLPALDGKTPREAVRTAKGRKQVVAVLKDMENGADRKRRKGEPAYDFARLRAELGLG